MIFGDRLYKKKTQSCPSLKINLRERSFYLRRHQKIIHLSKLIYEEEVYQYSLFSDHGHASFPVRAMGSCSVVAEGAPGGADYDDNLHIGGGSTRWQRCGRVDDGASSMGLVGTSMGSASLAIGFCFLFLNLCLEEGT